MLNTSSFSSESNTPLSPVNQIRKVYSTLSIHYVYKTSSLACGDLCYGAGYQSKTSSDGSKMDTTDESNFQSCELSN